MQYFYALYSSVDNASEADYLYKILLLGDSGKNPQFPTLNPLLIVYRGGKKLLFPSVDGT